MKNYSYPLVAAAFGIFIGFFLCILATPVPTETRCTTYTVKRQVATSYVLKPPQIPPELARCPVVEPVKCLEQNPQVDVSNTKDDVPVKRHRGRRRWR